MNTTNIKINCSNEEVNYMIMMDGIFLFHPDNYMTNKSMKRGFAEEFGILKSS